MQPSDFVRTQHGAGRIVGVGEEHHAGPLAYQRQQGVHIGPVIGIGRDHRGRAATPRRDVINRKAVADVQHLVARPGKALRGDVEQFVRPGPAHDPRRIDPMQRANGGA